MLCWLADNPKVIAQLKASQPSLKKWSSIWKLLTNNFSRLLD